MSSRKFALIGGSVMLVMGLFALIPTLSVYTPSLPSLNVEASYGYFLRIFPMNIFNKLALIIFGITGILCSNTIALEERAQSSASINRKNDMTLSILWSRVVLYVMGVLAILGIFQQTNTLGGYWPLFGNEIWFHALFAVLGGYFGYVLHEDTSKKVTNTMHRV